MDASLKPLLHTWSLSVEEQFYLLFPWLVYATRRMPRVVLVAVIGVTGFASYVASDFYWYHPWVTYYLLPGRAWELLLGALLAAVAPACGVPRWLDELVSLAGLLAIGYVVVCHDPTTPFTGQTALLPCLGAASFIWANARRRTVSGGLLAAPPMVFMGLISYSLYLWHWPVLVFCAYWADGPLSTSQRLLLMLLAAVPAYLSWRYVETPIRTRVVLKSRSRLFAVAGVATLLLVAAGVVIVRTEGVPARLPPLAAALARGATDFVPVHNVSVAEAQAGNFQELGATNDTRRPLRFLVWGDSHAQAALPLLDALARDHGVRGVAATHVLTTPLIGYRSGGFKHGDETLLFNDAVVRFIAQHRIRDVLIVARWDVVLVPDGSAEVLRRALADTTRALQGAGARVWILRQVPLQGCDVPRVLTRAALHGHDVGALGLTQARHASMREREDAIYRNLTGPGITILDPSDCFRTANGMLAMQHGGRALYIDHHHLSVAGAQMLRPVFVPVFEAMADESR